MIRQNFVNAKRGIGTVAMLVLMLALAAVGRTQDMGAGKNDAHMKDDLAIRQVVAGFSEGWNRHDAAFMCTSLADDVQWITWTGGVIQSRKEVQSVHTKVLTGNEKDSHRVDEVKSVTYLRPDLASVDDYWTMTGSHNAPYRAGYVNFLMEHRGDRWLIVMSHTADFNAKAPESAK